MFFFFSLIHVLGFIQFSIMADQREIVMGSVSGLDLRAVYGQTKILAYTRSILDGYVKFIIQVQTNIIPRFENVDKSTRKQTDVIGVFKNISAHLIRCIIT